MLKLGSLQKPTMKFSEWLRSGGRKGRYPIVLVFKPLKYPSGAVIFETGSTRVRYSIRQEMYIHVRELVKVGKYRLYFVLTEQSYGIEWEETQEGSYEETDWGWRWV